MAKKEAHEEAELSLEERQVLALELLGGNLGELALAIRENSVANTRNVDVGLLAAEKIIARMGEVQRPPPAPRAPAPPPFARQPPPQPSDDNGELDDDDDDVDRRPARSKTERRDRLRAAGKVKKSSSLIGQPGRR